MKLNLISSCIIKRCFLQKLAILCISLLFTNQTHAQEAKKYHYDTTKPWTYWWWMGSAVDRANIDQSLNEFAQSGLGGVHIIPIYGVKNYEDKFIPFLSEKWMMEVQYTIQKAKKLNLGVDITLGTGWPFGGSWVNKKNAAKFLFVADLELEEKHFQNIHESLKTKFWIDSLLAVYVINEKDTINLLQHFPKPTDFAKWVGKKAFIFATKATYQKVKRAAPGGEGLVVDYFNQKAVSRYLHHFDSVFKHTQYPIQPRAYYHDSYEVFKANWTDIFLEAFEQQHHYSLAKYLHLLIDTTHVYYPHLLHDVRATLAELLHSQFAEKWTKWCQEKGYLSRYQAHGSPANLLDLYALSAVPETESFGCSVFDIPDLHCDKDYEEHRYGRPSPLMMKFASSPAHLYRKPLVSSETGTWLANHFKVSLRKVKPQIDELFISGINHIFYHGTTYSPKEEKFPGWLFYASTNFGQSSHFWDELPLLNQYITNVQTQLQNSISDNHILLYFPLSDLWTKYKGDILLMQDVHHYAKWFSATSLGKTATTLWQNGYAFDYISDKQLLNLQIDEQKQVFIHHLAKYQTIVVPQMDYIPESTLKRLNELAEKGVKILFIENFPQYYAGLLAHQKQVKVVNAPLQLSTDILADLSVPKEDFKTKGLDFIRKKNKEGTLYFVTNLSNKNFADTLRLSVNYNYIKLINPHTNQSKYIPTNGAFYFELLSGESYLIQTLQEKPNNLTLQTITKPYDTLVLHNEWVVRFENYAQHNLQPNYTVKNQVLTSWTEWGDKNLESFCGKATYQSVLKVAKDKKVKKYILAFDHIHESAEIKINNVSYGTIWAFPNRLEIPVKALKSKNKIEIIVQNVSANQIKALEQQGYAWKKFYDINFVDITYKPFDASKWENEPAGLVGKIRLIKCQ